MSTPTVAVAHYPEGAGHATRMLAVARALEDGGAAVELAGGGPGQRFVELNGYEEHDLTRVDFIGDYQGGGDLASVLTNSVPDSVLRVRDYVRWLRTVDPDALVTDDMFATVAAPLAGVPLYVLTHNAPLLYEGLVERVATAGWTHYQRGVARAFFYPAVWPPVAGDPAGVERVPPVALDGDPPADLADPGVVVVPSHYSTAPGELAAAIRSAGHDVTLVGSDEWEPVPAMVPVLRAADAVVCAGYSTVMEAAVAGTRCVITPGTDEQRGVARLVQQSALPGFAVAESADEAAAALDDLDDPEPRENGAGTVAGAMLEDL